MITTADGWQRPICMDQRVYAPGDQWYIIAKLHLSTSKADFRPGAFAFSGLDCLPGGRYDSLREALIFQAHLDATLWIEVNAKDLVSKYTTRALKTLYVWCSWYYTWLRFCIGFNSISSWNLSLAISVHHLNRLSIYKLSANDENESILCLGNVPQFCLYTWIRESI